MQAQKTARILMRSYSTRVLRTEFEWQMPYEITSTRIIVLRSTIHLRCYYCTAYVIQRLQNAHTLAGEIIVGSLALLTSPSYSRSVHSSYEGYDTEDTYNS